MKTYYSRGLIVVKDKFNITYLLSKIEYFIMKMKLLNMCLRLVIQQ